MHGMIRTRQTDRTNGGYTLTLRLCRVLADPEINHWIGCISYQRRITDTAFLFVEETELCIPLNPMILALPLVLIVDEVFGITKIQIMGITRECCA